MIAVVDYGLGNVQAFLNIYKRLNLEARRARTGVELEGATNLILPGVGTFDYAMRRLNDSGMRAPLEELVLGRKVPILGVCVGMQILARTSEEGSEPGLGWIGGVVRSLESRGGERELPLPHMGWNEVRPVAGGGLFDGLDQGGRFYFLHSYYLECDRPEDLLAQTTYGTEFCCTVKSGNIHGAQFHPEKSHRTGARFLQNFAVA